MKKAVLGSFLWALGALSATSLLANPLATVDLSGTWTFTPLSASATTIQVPGGGWYKQGFTTVNEATYQRSITIPNTGQAQVTKIEFGAINYQATLYINGNLVGTQQTSFTPSLFDISNFVTPGQTYTLSVNVKGKNAPSLKNNGNWIVPNGAGWSPYSPQGIFRSAKIVAYPKISIADVFVRPSVQNNSLSYDVWVNNASSSSATLSISSGLNSWNGSAFSYPAIADKSFTVNAGSNAKITVGPIAWGLGTSSYWWPNVPYQASYSAQLHNLNLTLKGSSGNLDSNTTRFGFKEVAQKSDGTNTNYYLNGIRVNFRGDSLQGVNYDAINYNGVGDAYDTYPGFLAGSNGWPQVVANYQRLNYNFVRIHQEPASPYMLGVCDEMGLMVMEETAIRGSNHDQDFAVGHDNMVNHLIALFTRDRNHPSIVRWSQSNEPDLSPTDSIQFETDLYNATMSVDSTRPVSIDSFGNNYDALAYGNFSIFRHYGSGLDNYTENVYARTDRPYGEGECVWSADNTKKGFAWFATGTQAMRRQGASDIRPYTLLSAWISLVPGVNTGDVFLEQGVVGWQGSTNGYPLYGANNLSNPWANPQFQRMQAAFSPVLVADRDYWELAKLSNANGDWPATVPSLGPNSQVTRTLDIYNDTFSGTTVDVFWEIRSGSPTGALLSSGALHPTVPLGYVSTQSISFNTPGCNSTFYLVLYAQKSGVEVFRENGLVFSVGNSQTPANDSVTGSANSQFNFQGNWSYGNDPGCYSGDNHWSSEANATCQVAFYGTQIKWLGAKAPAHGIMALSMDGGSETTVDCYVATRQDQVVLFDSGVLPLGQHSLKVRVTGNKNPSASNVYINADEVVVLNNSCGSQTSTPTQTPTVTATPPASQGIWRINSGAGAYTDSLGNAWAADANYSGGQVNGTTQTVTGTNDSKLYQDERWGSLSYRFPVPAGSYQVTLKFAETYWSSASKRVFNVSINGSQVLTNLDIFAEVGINKADDKIFSNVVPSNGQIVVQFGPASVDNALIDAIQIIPMPSNPTATPTATRTPSATSTPAVTSGIPVGQYISLQAQANGLFVSANCQGCNLIASKSSVGNSEKFFVQSQGGDAVALRALMNNQWVCAENAGANPLIANRAAVGGWETFQWIPLGNGKIALKATGANNMYVCADSAGANPLIANRTAIGGWETYTVLLYGPNGTSAPVLLAREGTKVQPVDDGLLSTKAMVVGPNPAKDQAHVVFRMDEPGDARISFAGISGDVALQKQLGELAAGRQQLTVDISGLASGLYIVVFEEKNSSGWHTKASFKLAVIK